METLKVKDVDLMRCSMALLIVQQGMETVNKGLQALRDELRPTGVFVSSSEHTYCIEGVGVIGRNKALDPAKVGIEVLAKSPTFKELWESGKIQRVTGAEVDRRAEQEWRQRMEKDSRGTPDCPILDEDVADFIEGLKPPTKEMRREMRKLATWIRKTNKGERERVTMSGGSPDPSADEPASEGLIKAAIRAAEAELAKKPERATHREYCRPAVKVKRK